MNDLDPRWEKLRREIDEVVEDTRNRKLTSGEAARKILQIQKEMQNLTYVLECGTNPQAEHCSKARQMKC